LKSKNKQGEQTMKNKEILNCVHDFLGKVVRDCPDQEMGLEASNLADNVWDVLHSTEGLTFGQAIDACRYRGAKIQRVNWNGEGQFVRFEYITAYEDGGRAYPDERTVGSDCFVFHFVNRKTGETGIQVGWLASQADMSASDWRIVE
jgi:hypothetical protein